MNAYSTRHEPLTLNKAVALGWRITTITREIAEHAGNGIVRYTGSTTFAASRDDDSAPITAALQSELLTQIDELETGTT